MFRLFHIILFVVFFLLSNGLVLSYSRDTKLHNTCIRTSLYSSQIYIILHVSCIYLKFDLS